LTNIKFNVLPAIKLLIIFISFLIFFQSNLFASNIDFNEEEFLSDIMWDKLVNLPSNKRPKIALVLGGGGARGFAHLGVLKTFENEKVPIDLTVGTSIGSIVGAFYCAGISMHYLDRLSNSLKWSAISNYNVPSLLSMLISENLLSNKEIESFMEHHMGDIDFNDLKIPLVCIATDLNTGERILLREGNVAFAARASSTIPGIFKPVEYKQRLLVDGGLYENIPVNIARIFEPDIVIAISVSADISKNPTDNIFFVLMQAIYIQGKMFDDSNMREADIVISPEVGDISAIDLKKSRQAINKGFYTSQKDINNLKHLLINRTKGEFLFE
jgi:NTE family protein